MPSLLYLYFKPQTVWRRDQLGGPHTAQHPPQLPHALPTNTSPPRSHPPHLNCWRFRLLGAWPGLALCMDMGPWRHYLPARTHHTSLHAQRVLQDPPLHTTSHGVSSRLPGSCFQHHIEQPDTMPTRWRYDPANSWGLKEQQDEGWGGGGCPHKILELPSSAVTQVPRAGQWSLPAAQRPQ